MMLEYMQSIKHKVSIKGDTVMVLAMIGILVVLFAPIPAMLLDLMLMVNLTMALLILVLTFSMEKPLEFSTFPSLLLIATLFRLALNISATRLILAKGEAGQVINAVGEYVVSGNTVIGLVVFLILIVVQYVVVTNGAQRVAEVAARFILDSMPGKQMSIDADLNMGLIDQEGANKRRSELEKEANFYGAMDGASKFVKGDAIAGILIVAIDIVGGLLVGMLQKSMSWSDAIEQYTLLTVGDGIVTQIPALIVSVATGIIITRANTDTQLGNELARQISKHPKSLVFVGILLACFLLMPGMPLLPVIMVLTIVAGFALQKKLSKKDDMQTEITVAQADSPRDLEIILPEFIHDNSTALASIEQKLRNHLQSYKNEMGMDLDLPSIKSQAGAKYEVRIRGARLAEYTVERDKLLAINPGNAAVEYNLQACREPTYGLQAYWINPSQKEELQTKGFTVVDIPTIIVTHVIQLIAANIKEFITRSKVQQLLVEQAAHSKSLVDELLPSLLTLTQFKQIIQNLLVEEVPVKQFDVILETLIENAVEIKDTDLLTAKIRERLAATIYERLVKDKHELNVLSIEPGLEQTLIQTLVGKSTVPEWSIENFLRMSMQQVSKMMSQSLMPVIICRPELRKKLRETLERVMPQVSVISLGEIPKNANLRSFGVLRTQVEGLHE